MRCKLFLKLALLSHTACLSFSINNYNLCKIKSKLLVMCTRLYIVL